MTIFSDIMKNHCGQLPVVYRGGRISVSQRGRIKIVIERFRAMTTDTELKQITAGGDDVPAVLLRLNNLIVRRLRQYYIAAKKKPHSTFQPDDKKKPPNNYLVLQWPSLDNYISRVKKDTCMAARPRADKASFRQFRKEIGDTAPTTSALASAGKSWAGRFKGYSFTAMLAGTEEQQGEPSGGNLGPSSSS